MYNLSPSSLTKYGTFHGQDGTIFEFELVSKHEVSQLRRSKLTTLFTLHNSHASDSANKPALFHPLSTTILNHLSEVSTPLYTLNQSMAIIRYKRTTADDNSCYKIGKMILTLHAKSIFIFSTLAGVVLATNNLRELRTHHKNDDRHTVESSPSYQGPTITLDKDAYAEGEDITVTFSVGAPTDKFYNSVDAPSLDLDFDYPKWKIGLFMRDAVPQGGSLEPIVIINLCGALNCDADNLNYEDYASSVTFGDEYESLMVGSWPI